MSPTDLQDSTKNTERNQIEKTAKPPGRPRKYNTEQKVKRRNITVTDKTWEAIEQISKFFELGSRSELLEKISGKTLQVINPIEEIRFPPIDEMPVLPRLLSLLQKTAYLRSILSFARLVAISVGLNKDRYEKEELIEKVVINAVIFVALRDYSYPDYIVSSALADIRWLIFRQLTSKAEISLDIDACKSIQLEFNPKKLELNEFNESIQKIFYSICLLSTTHPTEYQIYKMRMMEGLTWEQIYRLLKLRNRNITKNDIRTQNHTAVAAIRDIWHSPEMEIENITTNKDKFKDIFNCLRESLSIGEKYYKFIVQTCEKDKKYELFSEWECFLIEAMHNPKFDLLIPEIHHVWAHEDKTIEMTNYRECQDRVINNINIKFSAQLEERLNSLKEKLKLYGTDRQSVRDTLMKFISTDVNFKFVSTDPSFDIPESIFLGIR